MAKAPSLPIFLKAITIQGFKSFADKVKLELGQGLSVVVGPNGSGKSNVADAVRWALGEQSAKNLRGSKMEDVIFAGSTARRPVGMAEVSLIFDNSTGIFPLDFREVTVTRRVYRDGEGQFFINHTPCRLKDIHELFMDTGAGKEGFSIIGQGRVEEILNLKSEERRVLIEEAAGITKYRMRKREALKRLDETERNLERINDIFSEIEGQLAPLEEQARVAKESIQLKTEQKTLEIQIVVRDLIEIREKLNLVTKEVEELKDSFALVATNLGQQESELLQDKYKLNNLDEKISKSQEFSYQLDQSLNKLTQDIRIAQERLRFIEEQIARVSNEIKTDEERISHSRQKIEALETRKRVLIKTLEDSNQSLKEKEEKLFLAKSSQGIQDISSLTKELQELKENQTKLNTEHNIVYNKLISAQKILEQLFIEKTNLSQQKRTYENELEGFKLKIQEGESEEKNNLIEITNKETDLDGILIEEKAQYNKLNLLNRELDQIKAKYNALRNLEDSLEGYSRGVRQLLQAKKKNNPACEGLCGTVRDLIKVEEKYEIAVETALGAGLQNIIAETEKDAKAAVAFLKTNKLGRATFLPLDVIRGGKVSVTKEVSIDPGYIGIAVELVSFQEKYRPAMESQLGRILVVEDMEAATRVARLMGYRVRIVTLDGDQVHPGGSLTGGSFQQKGGNLLGRSRELQELKAKLGSLSTVQKEENRNLAEIADRKLELETYIGKLKHKNQELKEKLLVTREQLKHSLVQYERIEKELRDIEVREKSVTKEIEDYSFQLKKLTESLQKGAEQVEKAQEFLSQQEKRERERAVAAEGIKEQLTEIKIQVARFEQELRQTEEGIDQEKIFLDERQGSLEEKTQELINLNTGKVEKLREIEEFNEQHKKITEALTLAQAELSNLRSQREVQSKKIVDLESQVLKKQKEQQALDQKIHMLEIRLARWDTEWETGITRLKEEFEMSWDKAQEYKTDTERSILLSKVQEIKGKIEKLGPVNEASIEEYPKMLQRYEFLDTQKRDLEEADSSLRQLIIELDKTMSERFSEGFRAVNEAFKVVFKELFNGGFAELKLDDPNNLLETGVEIIAQPPGKKPQLLSLLSGGERALTAIALLFALLRVKPSPFCILDEIEASLDDANVSRFAQYIHKLSHSTQFLVISHRKGTMEAADVLYGVSMEESGVSKILSVKLENQDNEVESA